MNIQEWREQTNGMEKETRTVRKNMLSDHLVVAHHTPPSGLAREGPHCARLRSHHVSPFCLAWLSQRQDFSLTSSRVTKLPLSRGHLRSQQQ